MSFSDRIVIVTGAGGGVGTHITRCWLDAGAKVVGAGSSEKSLATLDDHPNLKTLAADLTTEDGAQKMVEFARAEFGMPDTLIHTVGGFDMGPVTGENAASQWEKLMALNVTSAFHCYRAIIPSLREKEGGWIVGIGSRAGVEPAAQMAAYSASKAALIAFTQALALEVRAENIHVNVILPSTIDTPANRTAMGDKNVAKWVTPGDIADATFYLCSNTARSVYGATLELYGKS